MRWQFWIHHSPSFAQTKLVGVSLAEVICPFLSTYMIKDVILRLDTGVKNPVRTHKWLTTRVSHRSCILLFSTVESFFIDFCQQRHFCPSCALTNVFFHSLPVIGSAYNTSWHQLDCIIWDFFSLLFPPTAMASLENVTVHLSRKYTAWVTFWVHKQLQHCWLAKPNISDNVVQYHTFSYSRHWMRISAVQILYTKHLYTPVEHSFPCVTWPSICLSLQLFEVGACLPWWPFH